MSILRLFRKLCGKQALAFIAVAAMVASLIQPASIVHATDDTGDHRQIEKIESFTGKLVRGATLENGKYIWSAKTDADDHRFTFRVDFSLSGVKELTPGAIKIWIPKTILKDRKGNYADYMDLSYPSEDEYKEASEEDKKDVDYTWKESTDEAHKDCIEITNVKERTAGENGYFEVSYITNKQTFEYKDEATYKDGKYVINKTPQSDPFYADISVTNTSEGAPQTVTATTDKTPVYINTTAEISSTTKKYPNRLYKKWQSSWGAQPEETKDMYFLVWQIVSNIKKDPTQPYRFTLEDKPVSDELKLIGYSMNSENGPFTDKNYVTNQRTDDERYDYVLTYYDPNTKTLKDKDQYELKNSVKATVTPEDGVDDPTSARSEKVWEWDNPKFTGLRGHFYGRKFGDGNWDRVKDFNQKYEIGNTEWWPTYGPYHDYSSYSLDQLQNGKVTSLDTFAFGINSYGFPADWTVDGDRLNHNDYFSKKKPVKYELTDEELYLHENIKAEDVGTDQLKFTIPENAHRLNADDYQFLSARWQMHSEWRTFDDDEQAFVVDNSGKYTDSDIVHFWVKSKVTGTDEYKEVASYNLGSGKSEIKDDRVVKSLNGEEIKYKESADVTGIRFTTSNAYWFTNLSATPVVRLKNSDFVMGRIKDKDMVRLYNFSLSNAYDSGGSEIYGLKSYGYDRAIRPKRESEITKHIASTGSDKVRKKYIIRWKIKQKETLTTDEGTDYLTQKSGKFYDLLPKGLHLQKGSVDIETEKGLLSHSSFSYSVEEDYKGSGRDMVTIEIPVGAKYYNLYFSSEISWTDIRDYGGSINNPVAYETGNEDIWDGHPDDAYGMSDANKGYMMHLDPKSTTNRFIYDEEPHDIDTITAAVSGLKKQIKDSRDASYSYETYTTTNGSYSYKIRFANTVTDKAKNMIFFDSLENYNLNGKHSDWHGVLKRFDVSQLKQMGINPVIYVSKTADLSIDDHHDITDTSVWEKVTKDTNLSEMHAFAIDCRKTSDGKDFILNEGESISAVVYMKAPESVSEVKGEYAKAYNNIYIQDTIMSGKTESTFFIHQDYTVIAYRVEADIRLHKQNANDANEAVEGAKYKLSGRSDYGVEVNEEVTTGAQGDVVFEGIQKGTYTLKETYSPDDWLLDRTEYTVKVDGAGRVTCNGKEAESKKIIMKDSPRIHGNISFQKLSTVDNDMVKGAKFRLSGKSKYGNEIMMYATSGANGKVRFDNVEYGSYKIKEVETPEGYISVSKEYDASVSDTGFGSIDDAETLSDGTKVIRNEPYHTVEISKQSSYGNHDFLSGAEFRMTGTSSYGTPYDRTAVSGSNGIARFTEVESGKYVLQETKAPADHIIDTAKRMVDVKSNGEYSISGLDENANGILTWYNAHDTGKIIVRKKWKDVDKSKRPTDPPIIRITTDIKDVPTYVEWRKDQNASDCKTYNDYDRGKWALRCVDENYKDKTVDFKYSDISEKPDNVTAVRLDKNFNDPDARFKIYGWLTDDGTMHYWTNAQKIRMTNEDRNLFTDMENMKSADLSHMDMSRMTDTSWMFYNCCNLESLNLSGFKKATLTKTSHMFWYCTNLTSLNLTPIDMSNVEDMSSMFATCNSLASLKLPEINTVASKNVDMSDMFDMCNGLTSLTLKIDTSKSNSVDMSNMFDNCHNLTLLDLSSWDTSKVTDMGVMFYDCKKLTSLDLSSWDTSSVTNMSHMFSRCSSLTNIYVSDKWNTDKVTSSGEMFHWSDQLPNYGSPFDKTHANYGSDGYLTYKAAPKAKANISNTIFASRLVSMILSRLTVPVYAADSASYISTDKDHCTITKDGDTWIYEFTVEDGSTKYYAYEEDVEGYTSSNDANSYGIVTKEEPLTITNTATDYNEPKPASLSLSKTVDEAKYSHTSNIDDTGKANGQYSNDLNTKGDVVTIPGASKLHVKLYCSTESTSYDWTCVWAGNHSDYTAKENYSSSKLGTKSGKIGGGKKTSMSDITPIEGDIDGDTVTFGFRSDESNDYYGYYAIVTGYDVDGNAVENIPAEYNNKVYMFDVTIRNDDSSKLSGTKIFGDAVFTDGKAQVGVKAGETKTFSDLPGGTSYTITEKKYDDFITTSKNATGTLHAGDNVEAKFTNHYQKPKTPDTPKEYSAFTLKKELTGYYDKDKHEKQKFTFDVSLKKLDPNTEYTLSDGTKFTSDADGYGYVQVGLGNGETISFTGLPVGALYKVTEEGGDWLPSYKIKNGSSEGDISQSAGSAEKGQQLSTAWETADKGEDITVDYTNTLKKYQSLVLRKVVSGGEAPDKFRFRIDFANLYETVRSDAGTIVPEDDGTTSADVYLSAGDEMTFSSIPVTVRYKITEEKNAGKASYEIRVDNDKPVTGKNDEPGKDLSTAEETVCEGKNATVTFRNIMPKSASITLKKQVDGVFANKSKFFRFTVSVSNAAKKQSYLIDLTNGSSEYNDGKKNPQYIKTDENGRGSTDVWLKHDDEIVLKNLPLEAKYSIAEDATGYEKTITVNDSAAEEISNRDVADETVVFTNRKEPMILPTGLRNRTTIAMICTAIVFLISFFTICSRTMRKGKND